MLSFFKKKWGEVKNWLGETSLKPTSTSFQKKALEQPICRMLCVDDDRSFCLFIQQLAYSFGIQMDAVNSIQEAKEAIEATSDYQSFIIDGHLPDGSGFELVAWIREKKDLTLPIVFISRIYQDATSFRLLRESLKVNFVLEKPIQPTEVHQLFVQLCQLLALKTTPQQLFSNTLLLDLKISYQKTIPDKVERLEKMILDVQRNYNVEKLQALKGEVHKIAGSAGSYGYMSVSELCKNVELELIKQIDLLKQEQFNPAWLKTLDDFFTQIKLHFQIKISAFEFQISRKTGFLPTIYIVDEDKKFLQDFNQSLQHLDVEILTESHPEQAIQTLMVTDFYPEILFLNSHYSSSSLTGYELIKAFYQNSDELINVIALMVEAQSLENQVTALQRGISLIIVKPFLPSLLIPLLELVPFRALPLPFKVLIVDDDADICQYILQTLKYIGLEMTALQEVTDLEHIIKREQPDLILLDIHLSDSAGVKIFQRLRNDWDYQNLLIGMLTLTREENYLLQECYEASVSDLLFKPLERGVLQRKVALLLKKKVEEKLSAKQDNQLKWATLSTFKRYLNEIVSHFRVSFPKMLVVFEIKRGSHAHAKIHQEIIEYVSKAFENLLKQYEIATHVEGERFALIFQGYDPHFVQLFMRHFLEQVHIDLKRHFPNESFFICEALTLLSEGEKANHILQRSEELLSLAEQSKQSIRMVTDPSFIASQEAIVFQEEEELSFLIPLFTEQGFKVNVLHRIEELSLKEGNLPSLFVVAGSSIETIGRHLIKQLISQYHIQVPILHLPYLPNQTHLLTLLKEVHYFDAPFSLVILLNHV